jgi:hypothetical protein
MKNKEKLFEVVLDQIKEDFQNMDITAIVELLNKCTNKDLISYLPEHKQHQFKKNKNDKE